MSVIPVVALTVLAIAMGLVFVRLVLGPTLADRVVAIDVLTAVAIGFIATYVVASGATALLDAALVLALVGFMATVAFARFVEHQAVPEEVSP